MNDLINSWAKMVVSENYNPDDSKNDDFDKAADDYEAQKKEEEKVRKEMKESDSEDKEDTKDEVTEESPADRAWRMAQDVANKNKELNRQYDDSTIASVNVEGMDPDVVDGKENWIVYGNIRYKSGRTEEFEKVIENKDILEMTKKLNDAIRRKKLEGVYVSDEDAAIALIRVANNEDGIKWFFGPSEHSDDDWTFGDFFDPDNRGASQGSWKQGEYQNYRLTGDEMGDGSDDERLDDLESPEMRESEDEKPDEKKEPEEEKKPEEEKGEDKAEETEKKDDSEGQE